MSLTVFYRTVWDPAVLHYQLVSDSGGEAEWTDKSFEPTDKEGWQSISLQVPIGKLRFVCCNYLRTAWDNPPSPDGLRKDNYEIAVEEPAPAVYSLYDGLLTKIVGPPMALVTDLDGTLLGDDDALDAFKRHWDRSHLWRGSLLIYSTGRNLKDFLKIAREKELQQPAYAICGVGTEIYTFNASAKPTNENSHLSRLDVEAYIRDGMSPESFDPTVQDQDLQCPSWCPTRFHAILDQSWERIMASSFNRQDCLRRVKAALPSGIVNGNCYHDPFRLSVSVDAKELMPAQTTMDESLGALADTLSMYTLLLSGGVSWKYLDVLPKLGGKRFSMEFVCKDRHHLPASSIMVCGDSGNDVDMFCSPGVAACAVGNSQPDFLAFLHGLADDEGTKNLSLQASHFLARRRSLVPTTKIHFSELHCANAILDALQVHGMS